MIHWWLLVTVIQTCHRRTENFQCCTVLEEQLPSHQSDNKFGRKLNNNEPRFRFRNQTPILNKRTKHLRLPTRLIPVWKLHPGCHWVQGRTFWERLHSDRAVSGCGNVIKLRSFVTLAGSRRHLMDPSSRLTMDTPFRLVSSTATSKCETGDNTCVATQSSVTVLKC